MNPRIAGIAVGTLVGVVCLMPLASAIIPMDGDYSETVPVTYEIGDETITIDVPTEDHWTPLRSLGGFYYPRFVLEDDTAVRSVALSIMAMSDDARVRAEIALEFVQTQIAYVSDQEQHGTVDYWQLPYETLRSGTGDCEDKSILLVSIFKAMGIDAILVDEPYHLSAAVAVEGEGFTVEHKGSLYLTADATGAKAIGGREPIVEGTVGSEPDFLRFYVGVFLVLFVVLIGATIWAVRM